MKFLLLDDRIAVKQDDLDGQSPGGILLPTTDKKAQVKGTVVAVGPGKRNFNDPAKRIPLVIEVGNRVAFSAFVGTHAKGFADDGQDLLLLREEDIQAILAQGQVVG